MSLAETQRRQRKMGHGSSADSSATGLPASGGDGGQAPP